MNTVICVNERRYDGVSQRGWHRGYIFDAEFPVPESAEMLFWDFFCAIKNVCSVGRKNRDEILRNFFF